MITVTFKLGHHPITDRKVNGVINQACMDPGKGWYLFWVEDCFDPPVYLVRGESFEDAYDWFLTEKENLLAVDLDFLDDAEKNELITNGTLPGMDYNDNGTLIYTEAIQGTGDFSINWFHKKEAA